MRAVRLAGIIALWLTMLMVVPAAPAGATGEESGMAEPGLEPGQQYLVYFWAPTCPACHLVGPTIHDFVDAHPEVVLRALSLAERDSFPVFESYCMRYQVPPPLRGYIPLVFFGDDYLIGADEITLARLDEELEEMRAAGLVQAQRPTQTGEGPAGDPTGDAGGQSDREQAEAAIRERFRSFGVLGVALAGLVDGFNPCALTILSLYISYLYIARRRGGDVLASGAGFTLGVFLAYFIAGVGLYGLLSRLDISRLSGMLYPVAGLFAAALCLLSLVDYVRIRRHGPLASMLQLPGRLKGAARKVVRQGTRGGRDGRRDPSVDTNRRPVASRLRAGAIALATGAVVAVLAFLCTAQVYLPTIVYVAGDPDLRQRAIALLVVYNAMFCLPMIAIFAAVGFGARSERLAEWMGARTGVIRLALAAVFFALAVVMLSHA